MTFSVGLGLQETAREFHLRLVETVEDLYGLTGGAMQELLETDSDHWRLLDTNCYCLRLTVIF